MEQRGTSNTIDVLGLGAVAIDDLLYVDQYPPAESKTRVCRRERQCGGQTGTALVAAARFGAKAAYAGQLGNDVLSQEVIENFANERIETCWAPTSEKARPAHSTIIVDETAKTRTIFAFVDGDLGPAPNRPEPSIIQSSQILLIDHHGIEGSLRAARVARKANRPVVADFERAGEDPFQELLQVVDHLIVSLQFATEVTGESNPQRAAASLATSERCLVAVTCGDDGCYYWVKEEPDQVLHQPAFRVEVADTTGCGDVFHGVYAAALSRAMTPGACIRNATAAAALKASHRGGQAGIPRREAVDQFLAEQL